MPVWGMWHENQFWFSSSKASRKAKNLMANPRCVVTTEDADNPVVVEGTARLITSPEELAHPEWAFGLQAGDFTGSPTRWDFKN